MEADFKALLIIEHSCTHLLTLAASLYGRTWQQSSSTLLSGTSLCSNTGQSLSFTEKINVKLRDHLWWKSKIPVFVVSHTNCPEMFTHIILTVASLQIQSHLNEHSFYHRGCYTITRSSNVKRLHEIWGDLKGSEPRCIKIRGNVEFFLPVTVRIVSPGCRALICLQGGDAPVCLCTLI